jgi:hypothetical protein
VDGDDADFRRNPLRNPTSFLVERRPQNAGMVTTLPNVALAEDAMAPARGTCPG